MSEVPSTICGNNTHSISVNELTSTRYFRTKTQFVQLSGPPVQKFGDIRIPVNIRRNLVSGDGNPATKTSGLAMISFEFVGEHARVICTVICTV